MFWNTNTTCTPVSTSVNQGQSASSVKDCVALGYVPNPEAITIKDIKI